MLTILLALNAVWFFMAFYTFAVTPKNFAKAVIPRDQRDSPLVGILVESGRFLGGMNFALSLLNLLLILNLALFPEAKQWAILLFVFSVAHASQFIFNVPVALQNRKGGGVWPVFKMPMLFIFVTDFLMMVLNAVLAIWYWVGF